MTDEQIKSIRERLAEMRRLRSLHVAAVAKTATTGMEITQADEPDSYEEDVSALLDEVERLREKEAECNAYHSGSGFF